MEPSGSAEEIIGGERISLRDSAVPAIKAKAILESKLSVGAEKSFLITLTKEALFFSRRDESGQLQVSSKISLTDILAVEGVSEAHYKINNAPRRPAHFILHTFRWKDEKREKRKYAKLLVICADPPEKDRWVQRIELLLRSHPESMHNKRFKVLVNPFSGSKTAVRIWQECEALFKLSGVKYDVTNTAYTRHAKEIASQIDLRQYHAIVTVSGDGLLHEVVNGLMERSDWQRALSLLLAAIPAGSGNGLARSVGTVDPVTTAFEILKGRRRKLDLMHVVQAKASAYAFLSVTWALIADIDLESEGYRWMGEPRFTVAALGLVASPRAYKGRISWIPADKPADPSASGAASPAAASVAASPAPSSSSLASPLSTASPISSPAPASPALVPAAAAATEAVATDASKAAVKSPEPLSPPSVSGAAKLDPAPPAELPEPVELAPGEQLTSEGRLRDACIEGDLSAERGWVTQEASWTLCVGTNVTHLSSTACIAPEKKWGEGCLDLLLSSSADRGDLLSILLNLEDGSFVKKTPTVKYTKVKAFVIEPLCKEGIFSLDGERTEYTPLRCEVHPRLLNILG